MSTFRKLCLYATTFIFCFGCAFLLGSEEEKNEIVTSSFNYGKVSLGLPSAFSIDLGHRHQTNYHGMDYGIGVTPLIYVTEGHVYANYLYYPSPSKDFQFYIGVGGQAGIFGQAGESIIYKYFTPQIVLGKEFKKRGQEKKFIQITAGIGSLMNIKSFRYSSFNISAAFGF